MPVYSHLIRVEGVGYWQLIRAGNSDVCRSCDLCLQATTDTYPITHERDVGYDLQSSLILSDQTGQPIAPVAQRLVTADGSYATYQTEALCEDVASHLDEVTHCMGQLAQQDFARPLVHIIDREADSVAHIRQWEANQYHWLIRAKKTSRVEFQGQSIACGQVAEALPFNPSLTHNIKNLF